MTTRQESESARQATASNYGKITEEGLERMRARMGAYYYGGRCVGEITAQDIRSMGLRHGERNPLYLDEEYGKKTKHGGIIAPDPPTHRNFSATNLGGLPGVHSFHGGGERTMYKLVKPGDVVGTTFRPYKIVTKPSRYAGHMAIQYAQGIVVNQRDELVARNITWSVRTEREEARTRNVLGGIKKPKYTAEDLQDIWDAYDREEIRGAVPRYWEDVKEGSDLPTIARGPIRRSEVVFNAHFDIFSPGIGSSPDGNHWYRWSTSRRYRAFGERDPETGVPDHPHRGHWQDAISRWLRFYNTQRPHSALAWLTPLQKLHTFPTYHGVTHV